MTYLPACAYRPYTPVTDDDTLGRVEFVIKVYPGGKMTQIMDKMKVGDSMLMKGPRGRFQYSRNMKRAIGELVVWWLAVGQPGREGGRRVVFWRCSVEKAGSCSSGSWVVVVTVM